MVEDITMGLVRVERVHGHVDGEALEQQLTRDESTNSSGALVGIGGLLRRSNKLRMSGVQFDMV
jgi:hypothetical protein